MKLGAIIKRINLQRASKSEHLLPYDIFAEKIAQAVQLLSFVEENTKDKELRLEARKYFIITCISAMEIYFKSVVRTFVDAGWVNESFLSLLEKDKISLRDLLEINRKRISLGEIISVSYSFQDLETINRIYTKMLGLKDFMSEVSSFKVETEEETFILQDHYPDFREKIEELIKLRHLIVHHEGFKRLGLERLGQMWENLNAFVTAVDHYLLERIPAEVNEYENAYEN